MTDDDFQPKDELLFFERLLDDEFLRLTNKNHYEITEALATIHFNDFSQVLKDLAADLVNEWLDNRDSLPPMIDELPTTAELVGTNL